MDGASAGLEPYTYLISMYVLSMLGSIMRQISNDGKVLAVNHGIFIYVNSRYLSQLSNF